MRTKRPIVWMIVLCFACAPQAMAGMLIGSTLDAIYDIDPVTGVASNPRPTSQAFRITFVGDVLYGIKGQSIYTVDVDTGESTLLGTLPIPSVIGATDIAWDSANDRLLGLFLQPGRSSRTQIYEIDPISLDSRYIRNLESDYFSLSFAETGQLFAVDQISDEVGLLDLADLSTVSTSVLSAAIGNSAIASDGAGELFLVSRLVGEPSILHALNPFTGVLAPVGNTQTDSRFLSLAYIPEPGSLVLLLIASGVFFGRRVSTCSFYV